MNNITQMPNVTEWHYLFNNFDKKYTLIFVYQTMRFQKPTLSIIKIQYKYIIILKI